MAYTDKKRSKGFTKVNISTFYQILLYFKIYTIIFVPQMRSVMYKMSVGRYLKPVFHLATLIARREAKTRTRHRDWLNLAGEKIRREQVGTVPTFFFCSRE